MNTRVFEVPMDFGASRHGSDMGPSAIRLAGLKKRIEALGHTVCDSVALELEMQEYSKPGADKLRYLSSIVEGCSRLAKKIEKSVDNGEFPIILGGDHSIVLGSLAGLTAAANKKNKTIGVLYIDAHGDFNTPETSPSGNIHGMCMSASCGIGVPELTNLYYEGRKINPKNVCYIGCRDIDPGEKKLMQEADVKMFTMSDIELLGINTVMQEVCSFFKKKVDAIHISFDIDALDPQFAPGVGIQVPYGLTPREALFIMGEMAKTNMVCSCDVVEVNPVLDVCNQTAETAVHLIARLLGDTIY
ncbi:MAG TPA: arginase [Treponemataceae bacterium]|nr:arginase [Treponemataceae bacterium]